MMKPIRDFLISALLPALLLGAAPAFADTDQDEALKALKSGKIMSYSEIRRTVERQVNGTVIGQDPPRARGNKWVYDLRVLQAGGRVVNVEVDAQTGRVLRKIGN